MAILPHEIKPFAAKVDEIVKLLGWFVASVDHMKHIWSEYKRGAIPLEVSEHLRVTQKLSEVDVEEVATLLDHAESQHIY